MNTLTLKAETRAIFGKKNKALRRQGKIPAVVYGHGMQSESILISADEFKKIYNQAGESTLIDLVIDDRKPVKVIIQDLQYHPVNQKLLHVDFHRVRMTEKITTEVNLKFVGEAPAEKELGGVLVKNFDHLKIECLPTDLIQEIEVDLSSLKTFEDVIRISDLKIPKTIRIIAKPEEVIAVVKPPRTEEELKALEEKVEEKVEEVEIVKEKKKEEEISGEEEKASETKVTEK